MTINTQSFICSKIMQTQNNNGIKYIVVHLSTSKDEDIVAKL